MTPATPDSRSAHWPLAAFALAAALVGTLGCSRPAGKPVGNDTATQKGDPWQAAVARLKKDPDITTAKQTLATLNSDVGRHGSERFPAITAEQLQSLARLIPLSPADREELGGNAFSAHDPAYVADCLYLRDAASALGVSGLPPEEQARLAFAWVCRQVYLHPWARNVGTHTEPTVLPPTAVLRRGFGSGIERMYVFLGLLQQLGLDGCLVGGPGAADVQSRQGPALNYPTIQKFRVPRGPFWACGVRVGNDVRLFDPFRGMPYPVTFRQLKANPEQAKEWFEDKTNITAATLDDAKQATLYLAVPINSLTPRMALFQAKLGAALNVKFAFDLKTLESLQGALPQPKPAFWNPPIDDFAYGRASRSYLPLELGGNDRGVKDASRLYEMSLTAQIPPEVFRVREYQRLAPAAVQRLGASAVERLAVAFIEAPNPRERIQRGHFQDAAVELVSKQEAFAAGLERLRAADTGQQTEAIREWVARTNQLYDDLTRAESITKDPQAAAHVQEEIGKQWRLRPAQLIVDQLSAEVGRAEAAYLLALCKHEQAERAQVRVGQTGTDTNRAKTEARAAWRTTLGAWHTYEQLASAHEGFPGRAANARELSQRAAKFIEADAGK